MTLAQANQYFITLRNKYLLLLHFVVLIFGFTAIIGKLVSVQSEVLVWYRMGIASLALFIFSLLKPSQLKLDNGGKVKAFFIGFVVALHWILFFEAIKQSNVAITLAALSSASIFTALLEPIFFKRKLLWYEIVLGLIVISGLYFIYEVEVNSSLGLILGILSAFLASLFTVLNGKLIKNYPAIKLSTVELFGGFIAISLYFLTFKSIDLKSFELHSLDLIYTLILALICTAFAFAASVEVMKELSPFTVSLSINLEPVYGIVMAYFIFGESEKMSSGFYIGAICILLAIFLNVYFKRKMKG